MTDGSDLVRYARAKVREQLGGPPAAALEGAWTQAPGATFVTLRWRSGRLQGCIGSLEPRRALADDAAQNAIASAMTDPRAAPIGLADVDDLDFELSILSPLEPVSFADEADALAQITPGVHGVVLEWRGRRATFLPSMWGRLEGVGSFMAALKEKAGFAPDFWRDDMKVWRYTVDKHVDRAAGEAERSMSPP